MVGRKTILFTRPEVGPAPRTSFSLTVPLVQQWPGWRYEVRLNGDPGGHAKDPKSCHASGGAAGEACR